jgi:hypothetical protein
VWDQYDTSPNPFESVGDQNTLPNDRVTLCLLEVLHSSTRPRNEKPKIWVATKLATTIVATTPNRNYIVVIPRHLAYVTNKRELM